MITIGFTSVNTNSNKTITKINKLIKEVIFVIPIVKPDPRINPITAGAKNLSIFCGVLPVPFLKKAAIRSPTIKEGEITPKVATTEPRTP